ncbi:MAG TPA: hypothetical protein VH459_08205 [Gaiellales bacterium]|jgi:hypothetical protein
MSSSPPPPPREVRVTEYARRVARRWYVVLATMIVAVGLVFLHKVSGATNQSTATASVYLGQPLASGGGSVITQTPQSNAGIAVTFVKSTATLADAARAARLTSAKLHGHVSVIASNPSAGGTAGSAAKTTGGSPTISITVEGPWSRLRSEAAAESLAKSLIGFENRYSDIKRRQLKVRIAAEQAETERLQATIDRANAALQKIDSSSLSPVDKATASASWGEILASSTQRLGDISAQLPTDQIALAAVDSIESAQMISDAKGRQVSAVRRRSSFVVAAFIGFIVGVGLALAWDEVRTRRSGARA